MRKLNTLVLAGALVSACGVQKKLVTECRDQEQVSERAARVLGLDVDLKICSFVRGECARVLGSKFNSGGTCEVENSRVTVNVNGDVCVGHYREFHIGVTDCNQMTHSMTDLNVGSGLY